MSEIKEMIQYCKERGDIVFELHGVLYGVCSTVWFHKKQPTRWYFCKCISKNKWESIDSWGMFDSVEDIFNAKIFNEKSLVDLFDVVDFSMN